MTTRRQLPDLSRGSPSMGFVVGRRRPRRHGRRVLALAALVALAAMGLHGAERSSHADPGTLVAVDPERPAPPDARSAPAPPDVTVAEVPPAAPVAPVRAFASVDSLVLSLPSVDVLTVGFHEASLRGALAMTPIGTGLSNANTTRFTLPPDDPDGAAYHVMSSRGRVQPPTSAVDIVLHDDEDVLAPVDGVVTEVRPYLLYGAHSDTRVEIRPEDAPELRVVMIHVDDVQVEVGDRVTTGSTVVAGSANRFPFSSHVDRYLDERWPHVHLEVKDPDLAADR